MGFTIELFQLFGLPPLPNIYVSIHGSYKIEKRNFPGESGSYILIFTVFYQASKDHPVISERLMTLNVSSLPSPANVYNVIYEHVKEVLDPNYGSPAQSLVYIDDL